MTRRLFISAWRRSRFGDGRVTGSCGVCGSASGEIVVSGEDLTITRIDGLVMVSHKEPTADLIQLLTNLGVTPEMMSDIIIEVETPETPAG